MLVRLRYDEVSSQSLFHGFDEFIRDLEVAVSRAHVQSRLVFAVEIRASADEDSQSFCDGYDMCDLALCMFGVVGFDSVQSISSHFFDAVFAFCIGHAVAGHWVCPDGESAGCMDGIEA